MNIFVTGMTGTGKSYLIRYFIKKNKSLPFVAVSYKRSDLEGLRNNGIQLSINEITNENYLNIMKMDKLIGKVNLGFYMGFITDENAILFMNYLSNIIRTKENLIMYVDECQYFLNQYANYSKDLVALVSMAREKNIHIFLATQRPQDVQKSVLNNCRYKITFLLSESNAIKAMDRMLENINEDEIKNLKPFYFIAYDSYLGKIEKNQKI